MARPDWPDDDDETLHSASLRHWAPEGSRLLVTEALLCGSWVPLLRTACCECILNAGLKSVGLAKWPLERAYCLVGRVNIGRHVQCGAMQRAPRGVIHGARPCKACSEARSYVPSMRLLPIAQRPHHSARGRHSSESAKIYQNSVQMQAVLICDVDIAD
jgi:hypothetical protein